MRISIKEEKDLLRRRFFAERETLSVPVKKEALKAIHRNIIRVLDDVATGSTQVCGYRAVGDEVDPCVRPLTDWFFPRIEGKALTFWRPRSKDAFQVNRFGIPEPIPDQSKALDPKKPILALCPAIAVDSLGRRIGRGAGHYDRFFQAHPDAIRVGVVFHIQASQNPLPAEGWDQSLDWVITEKMILRVSQRSS
ncbi:MAG: 5-formyltetrahydrofolate cyclo-ligase [Bdellovibrionales bacterium]